MAVLTRVALGLAALTGAACLDPLLPAAFEGEPVYTHHNFSILSVDPLTAVRPRWAVFWLPQGLDPAARFEDDGIEQPGTSRPLRLQVGTLNLFTRPGADLLAVAPSGARYGVARIMAYADTDGDRRRGPGEPFLGADRFGLVYAPERIAAADSPSGRELPAGYHRVEFNLPCSRTADGVDACDVPVGDHCRGADDCGIGTCLRNEEPGFPNGTCAAIDATGCQPRGAVLFERPMRAAAPAVRAWIAACGSDADCRVADGYQCNVIVGGCLHDRGHEMHLEAIPRDPVCIAFAGTDPSVDAGVDPLPDGGVGPDVGVPPDGGRPDGGPPREVVPCETDQDCVGAPGPQPQHCDRQGICRPDR